MASNSYLIILLSFSLTIATVYADNPLAHNCFRSGIPHTPSFTSNLNLLLNTFQMNSPNLHYYENQVSGPGNDNVFGFVLCRGDTTISECKSCVSDAATEMKKVCVGEKEVGGASIWYDKCMIRYKDRAFYGEIDRSVDFFLWSVNLANNATEFTRRAKELLSRLVPICTKASSRFAHGPASYRGKTIHGMVQCSRDLSVENCGICLHNQIVQLGLFCCKGTEGGRVIGNSCNLRYEMYPFLRN